jgi:uncharacterized membrane protein
MPKTLSLDLVKTLTYLSIHLTVGFSVAYVLTGSAALAGGIALIEPVINAVAFFFHEQAWKRFQSRPISMKSHYNQASYA